MAFGIRTARTIAAVWLTLAAHGAPLAAQDAADPALAGHYYLSGIRETGSELLLRTDGRFEWYMSYGAVDQQADGQWKREGTTVVLTARRPDTAAPLFRLDSTAAWTAGAEQALLDWQYDAAQDAMAATCPVSTVAAPAMTPTLDGSTPAAAAPPDPPAPPPSPECRVPPRKSAQDLPPARWQRGLALELRTDKSGAGLRTVVATLHFSGAPDERMESRSGGIALRPGRSASPLTSVTLSAPFAPGKDVTLTVPPLREGVIHVLADEAQLVPPAFEVLHLRIEGGDLIPEEFGRGRYTRQP
jgi:hypothetical protein